MPTLQQVRLQLEHSLADLRMMEIAQRPAPAWTPRFKVGDRVRSVNTKREWTIGIVDVERQLYGMTIDTHACWEEDQLEPAPWTLTRSIPGFRALADGEEWHRNDGWTKEMLPEGWRPLLLNEVPKEGDALHMMGGRLWGDISPDYPSDATAGMLGRSAFLYRTRRPLPPLPATERVALTASDVPPGSVFRCPQVDFDPEWQMAVAISEKGVDLLRGTDSWVFLRFEELRKGGFQILRPGQTEWQPCSKESRA